MLRADEVMSIRATAVGFLPDTAAIARAGAARGVVACRVRPFSNLVVRSMPGFIPVGESRWELLVPAGTDVAPLDLLTINGTVYEAIDVLDPRSIEILRSVVCYINTAADGSLAYLHDNVTVLRKRAGVADMQRRVQIFHPSRDEVIQAAGGVIPIHVYESPDADWRALDRLTILALDGAALPPVVNYSVKSVTRVPAPLALTDLELAGGIQ